MNTCEILKAARDLISSPLRWTQGEFARDAAGDPCHWNSPSAFTHCALGAIYHVSWEANTADAFKALNQSADTLTSDDLLPHYYNDITLINDELGHQAVLQVYDHAIANACKEVTP